MIDYQIVDFMAGQLADQYAKQKAAGFFYPNEDDLPKFFRAQAAKLAANGVTSIYDVDTQERETEKIIAYNEDGSPVYGPSTEQFLINKQTGQDIRDVVLKPTWEEDPEAYRFRKPAILETTPAGFTRWGKDLSVEGQGDYGLNFVDGVPVYTPFWKDTATDPGAIIMAGALLGAGLYQLAGTGAAAGAANAAYNPMAGAEFAFAPEVATTAAASTPFYGDPFAGLETAAGQEAIASTATPYFGDPFAGLETTAGQKAIESTASSKNVLDTLRTANAVRSLLTPPVQPQMGLLGSRGGGQARGVDLSPMYQNTLVGLLPPAEIYRRPLL